MPYKIQQIECDGEHQWAVLSCSCNLTDANDLLILDTVVIVRKSYGEDAVVQDAQDLMADEIAGGTFDLSLLKTAARMGMPDPDAEGNKPQQLTNYRSQAAEMLAKRALAKAYNIQYPVAAQETIGNANQPILGFDGWGISKEDDGQYTLVLIQVKATDQKRQPLSEAIKLVEECRRVPRNPSAIARALTSMQILLKSLDNEMLRRATLRMLEGLGGEQLPNMYISPAIIRGTTTSSIDDLQPIRAAVADFTPAISRGVSVSIGVALDEFGRIVMQRARNAT
jgi:hypothetical protein